MNILAHAYTEVDLLWAARSNYLLASTLATNQYWTSGELLSGQVFSYLRLAKLELRLGRIYAALAWWHLALLTSNGIDDDLISDDERQRFDAFFSQTIANSDHNHLSALSKLPDWLSTHGLVVSESALLYVLGYEDLAKEYTKETSEGLVDFLKLARDTDMGAVPAEINLLSGKYPSLRTKVMGCEIEVAFPNRTPFLELSETILAGLESMLATSIVDSLIILEKKLVVEISADDADEIAISHEINDSDRDLVFEVLCSSFAHCRLTAEGQGTIQQWLQEFLIDAVGRIAQAKDPQQTFEVMFGEDRVLQRAVPFSSCFTALHNVFGEEAAATVISTFDVPNQRDFPLIRKEKWDAELPKKLPRTTRANSLVPGKGEPPADSFDSEKTKHSDYKLQGLINTRLWNQAEWQGVAFMESGGSSPVPALVLLFRNATPAEKIFEELIDTVGQDDPNNRLRVTIIRGVRRVSGVNYLVRSATTMMAG